MLTSEHCVFCFPPLCILEWRGTDGKAGFSISPAEDCRWLTALSPTTPETYPQFHVALLTRLQNWWLTVICWTLGVRLNITEMDKKFDVSVFSLCKVTSLAKKIQKKVRREIEIERDRQVETFRKSPPFFKSILVWISGILSNGSLFSQGFNRFLYSENYHPYLKHWVIKRGWGWLN